MSAREVIAWTMESLGAFDPTREADAVLVALHAAGYRIIHDSENHGPTPSVDDVAAALWREAAVDCGAPPSVVDGRTREAFDDQSDEVKNRWRKFARAAIRAMEKQDG